MKQLTEGAILFVAIFLMLLGAIFLIAAGTQNLITGAVLVAIAAMLMLFVYRSRKIEAAKPTLVTQNFNVRMEGSGQMEGKELKCRTCGAPLTDRNMKVVEGGVIMTCPYCNTITSLEESPKW